MEDKEFDKHLKKAITTEERKQQKLFLQSVEATIITKPKKTNWFVAASVILLVGFAGYFYMTHSTLTNEKLYKDLYLPYENVISPIVRSKDKLSKKQLAFAYYEEGIYKEAIIAFDYLTPNDSITISTIQFYKANAFLALDQLDNAKKIFTSVLTLNDKDWKTESKWYLALIALKQHKNQESKRYLLQIKQENPNYNLKEIEDLLGFID